MVRVVVSVSLVDESVSEDVDEVCVSLSVDEVSDDVDKVCVLLSVEEVSDDVDKVCVLLLVDEVCGPQVCQAGPERLSHSTGISVLTVSVLDKLVVLSLTGSENPPCGTAPSDPIINS